MNEEPAYRIEKMAITSKLLNFRQREFEGKGFYYSYTAHSLLSLDFKTIYTSVSVSIFEEDKEFILANFTMMYEFSAVHFDKVDLKEEGGAYTLPDKFEKHLNFMALNSTRGLIFSELRGTYLADAIMPIIDIDDLPA